LDDSGFPLKLKLVNSNRQDLAWMDCLTGNLEKSLTLAPATKDNFNWIEVTFPEEVAVRTIEFSSAEGFYHDFCYEPCVTVTVHAVLPDGNIREILDTDLPQSNWQDDQPISLACDEVKGIKTYRITIVNERRMSLGSLRLFSFARKNNWELEAGWT
jgi:hypothetical protein